MADTTEPGPAPAGATQAGPDVIARLSERGEQTMARLAELPGGARALGAFNDLRNRVDELTRRMRRVDELERRVTALEAELGELRGETKPEA